MGPLIGIDKMQPNCTHSFLIDPSLCTQKYLILRSMGLTWPTRIRENSQSLNRCWPICSFASFIKHPQSPGGHCIQNPLKTTWQERVLSFAGMSRLQALIEAHCFNFRIFEETVIDYCKWTVQTHCWLLIFLPNNWKLAALWDCTLKFKFDLLLEQPHTHLFEWMRTTLMSLGRPLIAQGHPFIVTYHRK